MPTSGPEGGGGGGGGGGEGDGGTAPPTAAPPVFSSPTKLHQQHNQPPLPDEPTTPTTNPPKKVLTLLPLIFLIYFEVSGGPYGEEPAVQAAGPLLAILGFVIFPFIWSIPEALITAELATAFPGNGGYVVWATEAFGPFYGHLMGSWKFLSGVINNAAYPVLCADYLSRAVPSLSSSSPHHAVRNAAIAGFTLLLSFLNYLGLAVVGYGGVALGVVSLLPFAFMGGYALPKLRPARWGSVAGRPRKKADWSLYFNTLFWNLNYWDNASTLAGEVSKPQKTFPKALLVAGLLTCVGYLVPLFAATGALDVDQSLWEDGFLADAAGMIAGNWLKYWVQAGSVLSAVGLYEAQLSTCAYQLQGMSELGIFPKAFASRSRWFNTPWLGILVSTAITLAISFLDFTNIVAAANFIYGLSMLLEFAAFVHLRRSLPDLPRPYRVPLRVPGLVVMCVVPSCFLVFLMVIGNWKVYAIGAGLTALGIAVYFVTGLCKEKRWVGFVEEPRVEGLDALRETKMALPR